MFVGVLECDVLLEPASPVQSLKHKRAVLRPVLARLRRLEVAVAEADQAGVHRRATIGIATVSGDAALVHRVLDRCEEQVAAELEVHLLSTRRRLIGQHDEE
ncbi:DUF503 domain-containing protein [Nakamurella leprariae]|uniref:DUF503 domain-containing protein n=1 Tax=Nakamurella leprariae TaxID=2803911 RepID=A0A939C0C5_9ACTN|nr:DUF503 domain-containing protein [Nakamurella leprariae]MBM9465879.1 DUF503 domain-containing protein [Nakamurella leprariae]